MFYCLEKEGKKNRRNKHMHTSETPSSPFTPHPIDLIWFHLGKGRGLGFFIFSMCFHHKVPKSQFEDNNMKFFNL